MNRNPARYPLVALASGTALMLLVVTAHAQNAPVTNWGPYFQDKHGQAPVVEPMEQYSDKEWLGLNFGSYAGLKPRIAVAPLTCTNGAPVDQLGNLLETGLVHSNRFVVLTRAELSRVMEEQGLGQGGLVTDVSAPRVGMLLGAQFVVVASVDEWLPEADQQSIESNSSKFFQELQAEKVTSALLLTIKLIDATDGRIVASESVRGTASAVGWHLSDVLPKDGLFGNLFGPNNKIDRKHQEPMANAVKCAINKAVYRITLSLRDKPWQGMLADADDEQLYIDGGSGSGLSPGMELNIYSRGKEILSPTTGQPIGFRSLLIGAARVTQVDENIAYAEVVRGCNKTKAKKGDLVRVPTPVGAVIPANSSTVATH